jgi:hypothetical protein
MPKIGTLKVRGRSEFSSVKIDIVALRIEALPHTYVLYLIDFSSQLFPLRDAESLTVAVTVSKNSNVGLSFSTNLLAMIPFPITTT